MKMTPLTPLSRLFIALAWLLPLGIFSFHPTTFAIIQNNFVYSVTFMVTLMLVYDSVRFFFFTIVPDLWNFGWKLVCWKDKVVNELILKWNTLLCTEYRTIVVTLSSVLMGMIIIDHVELLMRVHVLVAVPAFLLFFLSMTTLWSGAFAWRIHYTKRRARKRPAIAWRPDNSRKPARRFKPFKPKGPSQ